MKNNIWNKNIENVAKEIGNNAKGYKLMHLYQARKYIQCYNFLSITGIILGPLAGLLSGIEVALYPNENPTIPILISIFSSISGIIAAAIKFGKYDEMSISNKTAAARYSSIESNVKRQLNLNIEDRVSSKEYLNWLEDKYDDLQLSAPLIKPSIYKEYCEFSGKNKIPENYNENIIIEKNKKVEFLNNSSLEIDIDKITNKKIKRTNTMLHLSDINKFSDKMLQYELKRFIGFSS